MAAIITSTVEEEVVLQFPNAKDLRMRGMTKNQISDLMSLIQLRFMTKAPNKTLMLFGVPTKNLREYSHDNKKYGFIWVYIGFLWFPMIINRFTFEFMHFWSFSDFDLKILVFQLLKERLQKPSF